MKYGYWRIDSSSDVYILNNYKLRKISNFNFQIQLVINCKNLLGNCVGGNGTGNSLCFEGHIGALCEECDVI